MAASSTAAWRWAMNATAITSSSSSSSSSSAFQCRYRSTHVLKLSLEDSNSSSSSASSPSEPIGRRHRNRNKGNLDCPTAIPNLDSLTRKRQIPIGKSADGSYSVLGGDGSGGEAPESAIPPIRQLGLWKRAGLKLFFGKRPLWKRIFFASKKVRSIILLNVLTIIYASDIPIIKEVEEIMDPALFTVVRFTLSAIPFIPFMLEARGDGRARAAGMELGLWVSLGYIFQALGLLTSGAGRASFLSAFTVITVPFIDGIFGATVPSLTWFGAIVTLVGVGMLESSGSPPCAGDILNFFSAVFFGIHMLRTEHFSRVTSKEKFLTLLGFQVSVIAFLSIAWYLVMGGFGDLYRLMSTSWSWMEVQDFLTSFPWIPAFYTGIFSTGLCLWVEMAAMRDVSATETSIIYGLEPLWGAGFAWFLLGERWGIAGWIGAVLVLTGSLTVQIWGSLPEKTNEEEASVPCDELQSISKQDNFSVVPVIVNSTKNFIKQLKNE